jgi:hypothetical protein
VFIIQLLVSERAVTPYISPLAAVLNMILIYNLSHPCKNKATSAYHIIRVQYSDRSPSILCQHKYFNTRRTSKIVGLSYTYYALLS